MSTINIPSVENKASELYERYNAPQTGRRLFDMYVIARTVEGKEPLLTCLMETPAGAQMPSFIYRSHPDKNRLYDYIMDETRGRFAFSSSSYEDGVCTVNLSFRGANDKTIWISGLTNKNRSVLRGQLKKLESP